MDAHDPKTSTFGTAAAWDAIRAQVAGDAERIKAGFLQPACASFFVPSRRVPARGAALLLHGFTAGPWQYVNLAEQLSVAGLHCYAARLPGHGARTFTGLQDSGQLPKSHQGNLYAACAEQALNDVEVLTRCDNLPLYIVGFSAGAALTIDLLQRFPHKIARAVLISPLIKFHGRLTHLLFRSLARLPLSGRLTNRLRLTWQDAPPAPGAWSRPGHGAFFLGNVQGLADYTRRTGHVRGGLQVPCQFILTACDAKIDLAASIALARRGPVRHSLWCFPKAMGLAHSMLTPYENPNAASREKIYAITEDFLLNGRGYEQLLI